MSWLVRQKYLHVCLFVFEEKKRETIESLPRVSRGNSHTDDNCNNYSLHSGERLSVVFSSQQRNSEKINCFDESSETERRGEKNVFSSENA